MQQRIERKKREKEKNNNEKEKGWLNSVTTHLITNEQLLYIRNKRFIEVMCVHRVPADHFPKRKISFLKNERKKGVEDFLLLPWTSFDMHFCFDHI